MTMTLKCHTYAHLEGTHTHLCVNESHVTHKRARKLLATLPDTFIHDGNFVVFMYACCG